MEETQNDPVAPAGGGVSFPTVGQPTQKSGGGKTFLIVLALLLVGVLGFVIFKNANKNREIAEPTPFDNLTQPVETETEAPSPTSTAKPADKSNVEIEIQNGTGITGEAAYLQTQLKALGYTNIKVGNATTQNATATVVTFAKTLSSSVVDEITQKLKTIYQEVTVKTSTSLSTDILIVTGLRKGATTKPSATPTGTPKASATPTATPTATP